MTTHITKTWFDGEKLVTQEIPESEVYKQDPVAWVCYGASEKHDIDFQQDDIDALPVGTQLYTTPQPHREWIGLTDEEISNLWSWSMTHEAELTATTQQHAFARAIEAKLKEKNT